MSDRYKGAILSATPPTVIPQSAGGIYTSSQQLQYQGQGVWPQAVNNPVTRSLRFRASASAYLNRTLGTPTNNRIWTWSAWVKRGKLADTNIVFGAGDGTSNNFGAMQFTTGDVIQYSQINSGSYVVQVSTNAVFRDPSAWYHVVLVYDSTNATSTDRVQIYVNGTRQSVTYATGPFAQNTSSQINSALAHYISKLDYASLYFDGYLTEINFIDGVALTPSSFGTTNAYGVWQPIPYTGAYGTNGFYLPFTDNSALTTSSNAGLGKDFSGNSNYWTTNNISITSGSTYDSMTDVPTNTSATAANYAVWNPLKATAGTYSNGNLTLIRSSTANVDLPVSTIQIAKTVPVYCELRFGSSDASYGIAVSTSNAGSNGIVGSSSDGLSWGAYITTDASYRGFWNNNSRTAFDFSGGTVYQLAFDQANGKLWFGKDGTWYNSGDPSSGTNPTYSSISTTADFYIVALCPSTGCSVNFGQQGFTYTPPTGFNRLNTYNLPTPTILDGDQYFNAVTYTGTSGTQAVTGVGFQPDWVWIKARNSTLVHVLQDAVRGTTAYLQSNSSAAENTNTANNWFRSFDSDGFTVATLTSPGGVSTNEWNNTGYTYVSWNWKASNAAGVSNTQGTITSTVSANTTAGFSIVTYTGTGANATVGHGLGVAPSFIIAKARNSAQRWTVYTAALGNGYYGYLNETFAFDTANASLRWNTAPTSSVFGVGTSVDVNGNTTNYVAYCFAQVAGYSAFGSYTGNGSTDGPFVYTGFIPKFVIVKNTVDPNNWVTFDSARNTYNIVVSQLYPNASDAEATGSSTNGIDFLSNGFKIRSSFNWGNRNGDTIIYMAFAENPFKIARGR
jgi:hypothetical protein